MSQFEAVGLALAGFTFWVLADTSLKVVAAAGLPAYEVVAVLGLVVAAVLAVRAVWRKDVAALWPRNPRRQALRAGLDLANNAGVVIALRHLPLAMFYLLVFLAPMVTSLLAAACLGERLGWKKGLAILAGLLGVVVAVDPFHRGKPGDWTGYAACGVCVLCFSSSMVWSRVMTRTETPESLTFFSGSLMAVAGGACLLHHAAPMPGRVWLVMVGAGVFCTAGSLCYFVALKYAAAASVSQYHYSQLLTGALLAYAIWGERPTPAMLAGAVLIVGAGLYTAASSYAGQGGGVAGEWA